MTDFIRSISSHWPLDLPTVSSDLTGQWVKFRIYNSLVAEQITNQNREEELFNSWLLMADPSGNDATLALPPISADRLSGLDPDTLATLREMTTTLTQELTTPDSLSTIVPSLPLAIGDGTRGSHNLVLMRGKKEVGVISNTIIGEISPLLAMLLEKRRQAIIATLPPNKTKDLQARIKTAGKAGLPQALAELERYLLDRTVAEPIIQYSAYYKLIRNRYGVNTHLLASPSSAFFPIYGSHNQQVEAEVKGSFRSQYGEDIYGNLGDVLRDRAAWDRFINYVITIADQANEEGKTDTRRPIRIEASIIHFMNYRPVVYEMMARLLLDTKRPTTIFVVTGAGDRLPDSARRYLVADQRRTIDNERELIILSNETEKVVQTTRDLEDILICLGWRYVAPARTIPRLTTFEKAIAIGKRAVGLSKGEPMVLKDVSPDEIDVLNIADMEFERGVLPVQVLRRLPNGTVVRFDPNTETQLDD